MPKTIQGFLMTAATVLVIVAIATRVAPVAKIVGLPMAPPAGS